MYQPVAAYIGLGSNMGNRSRNIHKALQWIAQSRCIRITQVSTLIETEPEGGPTQRRYLNGAAEITTQISALELLAHLQECENNLGRERKVHWGPRTIDLDILLYGNEVINEDRLRIPHPRMHLREFVLKPLKEIAPDAWHPVLKKNVADLYADRTAPKP